MTARIDEIATALYRICLYVPAFDLQFNHFLVRDDQPLLFHPGMRGMFPAVREAVARLIDPADLRWISWSHFEVDECGALNEWLAVAPQATPVCGETGAMINIADFSQRSPVLMDYVPYTENTNATWRLWRRCGPACWRPCTARRSSATARRRSLPAETSSGRSPLARHRRSDDGRTRRSGAADALDAVG